MREQSEQPVAVQRLEWDRNEILGIGMRVIDTIADHLTSVPEKPVFRPYPPAPISAHTNTPPPEQGALP